MFLVTYSSAADDDLEAIVDYIARDKPNAAREWLKKVRSTCQMLAENPDVGEVREGFGVAGCRSYRLDNIDRALLSTDISRYERRQIVSTVEDQIQELVARIDKDEPSREDLLRILASLDPPEAYGSGSMQQDLEREGFRPANRLARTQLANRVEPQGASLAVVSVALGAASLLAIPTLFLMDMIAFVLSAVLSSAAMICGIVALCQVLNTKGKASSKVLSILGIVSFPVGLLSMLLFYLIVAS